MNLLTVAIDKMVANGQGLGRLADGRVIMVRGALPGETVRVRPVVEKKQYLEGEVHEVVAASTGRVEPRCPLFGRCGGCDFQHIAAREQLRLKRDVLLDILVRTGGLDRALVEKATTMPLASPDPYYYRQRIRLHVDDRGRPGFLRHRSHRVEPLAHCYLARPEINEVLGQLAVRDRAATLFRQVDSLELLLNPDLGSVILLLHRRDRPRPADQAAARQLVEEIAGLATVLWSLDNIGLVDTLNRRVEGDAAVLLRQTLRSRAIGPEASEAPQKLVFTWEAGGFSQVNGAQNANLIDCVVSWVKGRPARRVLDLYCGMGNFAVPLAHVAGEVLGLEVQGAAIRGARRNADLAGRTNCRFIKGAVEDGVAGLASDGASFDTVVLDPPRQGAATIVPLLPLLRPRRIIYISCDPATLARDLAGLVKADYSPAAIRLFDMFPQTHHLESAVLLEKQKKVKSGE